MTDQSDVEAGQGDEPTRPRSGGGMRTAAITGGRWTLIENLLVQALSLGVTLVLARLLAREDFGLIAAVTVAAGFYGLLGNVGFSASIIQRQDVSKERVSSIFWAAGGLSLVLTVGLVGISGLIATSMGLPEATPLLMLAATQLAFGVLATIPDAILRRRFQFKKSALVSIGSFLIYPPIAIGLAVLFDAGAWAVVIGQTLRPVAKLVLGMIAARWRPQWTFSGALVKEDFAFNGGFFVVAAVGFLIKNVDYWVVSRELGAELLGVYYMAFVIPSLVRQRLTWALGRVLLPVLSRVREDRKRFTRAFAETSRFMGLVSIPSLVGLALIAEPLVAVVLSPRWADAAAPLSLLALSAVADALSQVSFQSFVAEGTPMRTLQFTGPRAVVLAIGLAVAIATSGTLVAVSWAVLAAALVNMVIAHWVAVTRLSISLRYLLECYAPVVVPTAAMVAVLLASRQMLSDAPELVQLVALLVAGGTAFVGSGFLVSRAAFARLGRDMKTFIGRGPAQPAPARPEQP